MNCPPNHPDSQRKLPMVVLASSSPRRRKMLTDAGIEHKVSPAPIDDGDLNPGAGTCPDEWVAALAYLKANSSRLDAGDAVGTGSVVLGADTVCVHDGEIIGQPEDRDHAREIIKRMVDATHEVVTGIAILDSTGERREIFVDRSVVTVGSIADDEIEAYLDTDQWKGKAGAYNISERLSAGWPIEFTGDEMSIVGLPLSRVIDRVEKFYATVI